jgi:hypothetical protein
MRVRAFFYLFVVVLLAGCDQTPDQVYTPPVLSGKAFALAEAKHIAIVDLTSTALTRIKMDKKGLDLAIANKQLYVLADDGTIASLKDEKGLNPWQDGVPGGIAMAVGPEQSLWILAKKELRPFVPGQGPGKAIPLDSEYSALFFGEGPDTIWLVSREKATATPFNLTTAKAGTILTAIGNSVHMGQAFSGMNELWLAEGNEYMNGEPYGVGYTRQGRPAMPGGINVIDLKSGKQTDFIMVGGNVVDLTINQGQGKVFAAVSQLPDFIEASLSIIDTKSRRVTAELRLCQSCHMEANITLKDGEGKVRALAILQDGAP